MKKSSSSVKRIKILNRKNIMEEMIPKNIQTFVFLDLETTGLIRMNLPMPRITELAMVAVSRDCFHSSKNEMPRVKHKLVLPINPTNHIVPEVQQLTGLSNKNLTQVKPFTLSTKLLVHNFLEELKSPICFVAHNGNRFDYPILLSELRNIDSQDAKENIYTIDTLHFFKHYFQRVKEQGKENTSSNTTQKHAQSDVNVLLNDGYDNELCAALDAVIETLHQNKPEHSKQNISNITCQSPSKFKDNSSESNYCKQMQEVNEKTPESQIIKSKKIHADIQAGKNLGARRKLEFQSTPKNSTLRNYKLTTIYEYIFDTKPYDSHTAEGDCLILLHCAVKLGNVFIEWADVQAVNFYSHQKNLKP